MHKNKLSYNLYTIRDTLNNCPLERCTQSSTSNAGLPSSNPRIEASCALNCLTWKYLSAKPILNALNHSNINHRLTDLQYDDQVKAQDPCCSMYTNSHWHTIHLSYFSI